MDDPAVIEPRRGAREKALPRDCLLVFTPQDRELAHQCFEKPPQWTHRVFLVDVAVGRWEGVEMAVAGPMMGAPQAALTLDKLMALGVRRVIALGWCGSIQPHVRIGDVVLPTGALSEEGTSAHYPLGPGMDPGPNDGLARALGEALAKEPLGPGSSSTEGGDQRQTLHLGRVWSIDAPYRETVQKVLRYQRQGILGVDMETSALFTVARYRGIELACVLVVSDDLSTLQWVHGFRDTRFHTTRKQVLGAVLEALKMVSGHEQ